MRPETLIEVRRHIRAIDVALQAEITAVNLALQAEIERRKVRPHLMPQCSHCNYTVKAGEALAIKTNQAICPNCQRSMYEVSVFDFLKKEPVSPE